MRLKIGNVAWSALDAMLSSLQALVSAFVVARLIGPSEVGIGASVIATQLIAAQILSSMSDVIVQRRSVDERVAASATWYLVLLALLLGLIVFGFGLALTTMLDDPRIVPMSAWAALCLMPHAYAAVLSQWLVRHREFRLLFWRGAVCATAAMAVGIAMAASGYGAWAMVVPSALIPALSAVATAWVSRWRPPLRWRWAEVAPLLSFAVPQMLTGLAWGARYRVFFTLLTATAAPQVLGFVHMAFRAVDSVSQLLFATVQRLMLPQMARVQDDVPALREMHDRFVRLISLVALPIFGGLALCIGPLFSLGLGSGWEPAVHGAVPLAVLGAYQAWRLATSTAITARGMARQTMWLGIFVLILTTAAQVIWRPATPAEAAWIWAGPMIASIWPSQWVANRALHERLWSLLRPGLPALAATLVAAVAALAVEAVTPAGGAFAQLLLRGGVFSVVYAAIALGLLGGDVRDALGTAGFSRAPAVETGR